jgi:LPS-assembly lipoprotein
MIMTRLVQSAALLSLAFLAACGFQPVHSSAGLGPGNGVTSIVIPQIEGRSGHKLRKALLRELAPGLPGVETGTLTITLDETLRRLAIRPDEAAARTDITVRGRYILDTGTDAISGVADAESSFNVPVSAFGDIAAQTSASDRAVTQLARRIADDLRIKLAAAE